MTTWPAARVGGYRTAIQQRMSCCYSTLKEDPELHARYMYCNMYYKLVSLVRDCLTFDPNSPLVLRGIPVLFIPGNAGSHKQGVQDRHGDSAAVYF